MGRRRGVTENRALAARENRGDMNTVETERGMSHRVDATMNAVQPRRRDPSRRPALVDPGQAQLLKRHDTELRCGDPGHCAIAFVDLFSHTENKSTRARFLP